MAWSPLHAMKAYMDTLKLCKAYDNQDCNTNTSVLLEPKSMEFISAMAAGNQAQLMVDISPGSTSPSTLALAVAAKQTGGRLICIRSDRDSIERAKSQLAHLHLDEAVEFRCGRPCEVVKEYENVDFAVIDRRIRGSVAVFHALSMNPNGSVVVVNNIIECNLRRGWRSYGQVVKGRGVESVTLPIGDGMEVTRIGKKDRKEEEEEHDVKRSKRVFRVLEGSLKDGNGEKK